MGKNLALEWVERPGGRARADRRDREFVAVFELANGHRYERPLRVDSYTAARVLLPPLLDETIVLDATEEARQAALRKRGDDHRAELRLLVARVATLARRALTADEGCRLLFLLELHASDWLPPREWEAPEEIRSAGELMAHRMDVFRTMLKLWRPDASDFDLYWPVVQAPWDGPQRKTSSGKPLAAAAQVFQLLLEELGVKIATAPARELVFDLVGEATRLPKADAGRRTKSESVRGWLKGSSDRKLEAQRAEHARRLWEWYARGPDELQLRAILRGE